MHPQGFLLTLISIPNIILGTFVFLRNIKDKVNIFFGILAVSSGLWSLGLAGYIFSDDLSVARGWAQFYYIAALMIAYSFACFARSYALRWKNFKKELFYISVVPLIIGASIILFPKLLIDDIVVQEWGKEVILVSSSYLLYSVYFTGYVATGFIAIIKKFIHSTGIQRVYLNYIIKGLLVAFILGATFNLIYPFLGNYRYIWVGPLFTMVYVVFISYAILKHRLFDVRLVVARSLGYILSIFFVTLILGLGAFGVINHIITGEADIDLRQQIIYIGLAILIGFTFQPVKRFFDKATNSIFYQDAYDPQEFIDEHNKIVVSNTSVEPLLHDSSEVIIKYLKTEFCDFGLRETAYLPQRILGSAQLDIDDKDIEAVRKVTPHMGRQVIIADELTEEYSEVKERMQKYDIAILVRLATTTQYEIEGLGYMMLGAKKSGNPFNRQDIKVIEIIANELVIAIQNALRFEEIEKFNITLQEKVDDATRKLRHTNEKLKAMDETKDEFISMASHQLRTPLTSVKGYLSMVLEGDAGQVTEMQSKLLNQAFISSQRMVYLIADLLNVSRLRTGKFVIETKPTNLAEAVEGEVEQLKEVAASRDLTLTYEKPENFPVLELDETKIRQVVMNFTDNAIYYTPSGGHIKVELKDTGKTVEFTVTDNGIGVPKHEQPHLFSKFYRAVNAKKARPDGTGLGLFMAKKVVVAQGGAIIFKSQEGKGSTFGFSFAKSKIDTGDISA